MQSTRSFLRSDCGELCDEWDLDHTMAPVRRPTGNAISECFILTLKLEVIWARDWESRAELDAAVQRRLPKYNHDRPHQALGWKTPAEALDEHLRSLGHVSVATTP